MSQRITRRGFGCLCGSSLLFSNLAYAYDPTKDVSASEGKAGAEGQRQSSSPTSQVAAASMVCAFSNSALSTASAGPASDGIKQLIESEAQNLSVALGVKPVLQWLDDSSSPNAMAAFPGPPGTDGVVAMGVTLTGQILRQFTPILGAYGASVVVGMVLAHEYMHILYFKAVNQGIVGYAKGKRPELLADWFAGFHLNNRNWDTAIGTGGQVNISSAIIGAAHKSYSMGDNKFTSPSHHGTHMERASAFMNGVQVAEVRRRNGAPTSVNQVLGFARQYVGL